MILHALKLWTNIVDLEVICPPFDRRFSRDSMIPLHLQRWVFSPKERWIIRRIWCKLCWVCWRVFQGCCVTWTTRAPPAPATLMPSVTLAPSTALTPVPAPAATRVSTAPKTLTSANKVSAFCNRPVVVGTLSYSCEKTGLPIIIQIILTMMLTVTHSGHTWYSVSGLVHSGTRGWITN